MRKQNLIKITCLVLVMVFIAMMFTGCDKTIKLTINDLGKATEIEAKTGTTIEQILKDNNITLASADEVEPAKTETLTEDMKEITIKRSATVKVIYKGTVNEVTLVGKTVKDALKEANVKKEATDPISVKEDEFLTDGMEILVGKTLNIKLKIDDKEQDYVTTANNYSLLETEIRSRNVVDFEFMLGKEAKTPVKENDVVTIYKVTTKEETKKEEIKFETEEQYSDSMNSGESQVTQEGVNGEKEVTYKVIYLNGKEFKREKLDEKVTKKAVNQIIVYGTKEEQSNNSSNDSGGKTVVSSQKYYDCDGSGHGYEEITYSDGSTEIVEF